MAAHSPSSRTIGARDVGLGLLSLVSAALTVVAQVAWMIAFDASGLDAYTPYPLFMHVLPALTVALVPAVAARHYYTLKTALLAGGAVLVASAVLSTFTLRLFML